MQSDDELQERWASLLENVANDTNRLTRLIGNDFGDTNFVEVTPDFFFFSFGFPRLSDK